MEKGVYNVLIAKDLQTNSYSAFPSLCVICGTVASTLSITGDVLFPLEWVNQKNLITDPNSTIISNAAGRLLPTKSQSNLFFADAVKFKRPEWTQRADPESNLESINGPKFIQNISQFTASMQSMI